ncbi:hypothetical protein EYF80_026213 [Liparis tanakae]|uniref:Uncharacterized protein n=1 Tax=Liparis tanakae TaxID=230148 RepID=A0A4Z2HD50_9TELE|nr:hypothetical protein EYF80_026213 [Liparis tanakae]
MSRERNAVVAHLCGYERKDKGGLTTRTVGCKDVALSSPAIRVAARSETDKERQAEKPRVETKIFPQPSMSGSQMAPVSESQETGQPETYD